MLRREALAGREAVKSQRQEVYLAAFVIGVVLLLGGLWFLAWTGVEATGFGGVGDALRPMLLIGGGITFVGLLFLMSTCSR
jgi:hypothetical protein